MTTLPGITPRVRRRGRLERTVRFVPINQNTRACFFLLRASGLKPKPGGSFSSLPSGDGFERIELSMSKTLLSQRKAAAHLNIPVSTFSAIVKAGRGPRHFRVGNVCRFAISDLNQYLAAHTFEGSQ
jgi:hypothetical protein